MRTLALFVSLSLTTMFMPVLAARAGEEKVDVDKLPKPVLEAAKAKFPGAKVMGAGKEEENGKLVYEVTLNDKGQNIDVSVNPEGKILLVEKTIPAKSLPKAVKKAIKEKHPSSKIKRAEEIIKDDKLTSYELIVVTHEKKTFEVVFEPSGKFVKEEDKSKEKDGDEKGEKEKA